MSANTIFDHVKILFDYELHTECIKLVRKLYKQKPCGEKKIVLIVAFVISGFFVTLGLRSSTFNPNLDRALHDVDVLCRIPVSWTTISALRVCLSSGDAIEKINGKNKINDIYRYISRLYNPVPGCTVSVWDATNWRSHHNDPVDTNQTADTKNQFVSRQDDPLFE